MRRITIALLTTACVAALPAAGIAQTRKPAPRPAAPAPRAAAPVSAPAPAPAPGPAKTAGTNPFDVGSNVVNLGIGLGSRYSYALGAFGGNSSVLPAFSVSYERGVIPLGPGMLGIGGIVGYQSASYEYSGFKDRYTDLIVMVRGAFHYPVMPEFDAYGGVGLGVRHLGYSSNYVGPYSYDFGTTGVTSGLFVGGRYYFTPNLGAFAELGYDQTYLKAGLAVKF